MQIRERAQSRRERLLRERLRYREKLARERDRVSARLGSILAETGVQLTSAELSRLAPRRSFSAERVLHAYLKRLLLDRNLKHLKRVLEEEPSEHEEVKVYFGNKLRLYEGRFQGCFDDIVRLRERLENHFLKGDAQALLLEAGAMEGRVEALRDLISTMDNSRLTAVPRYTIMGVCRLFLKEGHEEACRVLVARYLEGATLEQRLYFAETMQACSMALPPDWNWREALQQFSQAYSAYDEEDRARFERCIVAPLARLPGGEADLIDVRFSEEKRRAVVELITQHLVAESPLSLVRVGDGSGYAYPFPAGVPPTWNLDQDNAGREIVWWGRRLPAPVRADIGERVRSAVADADILGLPSVYRVIASRGPGGSRFGDSRTQRGLIAVLGGLGTSIPYDGKHFTEERCHYVLFDKNTLENLSRDARKLVFVSCWTAEQLKFDAGCAVEHVLLPSDEKVKISARADGEEQLWQNYSAIASNVRDASGPGCLVLVAAGIIGKILVHQAKQAGGVAVDIGCMPDYFAGYKTRSIADLL